MEAETENYSPLNLRKWTRPDSYFGASWPDYYSSGFGQSRDSDCLEQSNFATALARLGGETETVVVVRESHWAVGWVGWIAIHESDSAALRIADEMRDRMEEYPVLDEMDWGERETEAANETWRHCYRPADRVRYIRDNRNQFDFRDWRDMRGCIRGDYFAGYASELLA
jgi:hypothetical protein